MTLPVFIVDSAALSEDVVDVSGSEGRHATVVRRIRAGEQIVLTDGAGRGAECLVVVTTPRGVVAEVEARRVEPAGSPRMTVVQALVKGDAADLAVDLLTQIGVDAIVPGRRLAVWRPGAVTVEQGASALADDGPRGGQASSTAALPSRAATAHHDASCQSPRRCDRRPSPARGERPAAGLSCGAAGRRRGARRRPRLIRSDE